MPPKVPMLSSRWMIMFVLQYQSDLRRELVTCLLAHGSLPKSWSLRQTRAVQSAVPT
jgi:hypothetical protein